MKPINVCIVVFNRFDLLTNLFRTIENSERKADQVFVINRGTGEDLDRAIVDSGITQAIETVPLGGQSLPEAWNWFMKHVPEDRIITSDDIEFWPETLQAFSDAPGEVVGILDGKSSHFACFMVRDSCIKKIGYFDESISPDYMYFEDCDYKRRMDLAGIALDGLPCMSHGLAQSWVMKTNEQQNDHHRRFVLAEGNYKAKWGGLPGEEVYEYPFGPRVLLYQMIPNVATSQRH